MKNWLRERWMDAVYVLSVCGIVVAMWCLADEDELPGLEFGLPRHAVEAANREVKQETKHENRRREILDLARKYGTPSGDYVFKGEYIMHYNGHYRCADWVLEYLDGDVLKPNVDRFAGAFESDPQIPVEFRATNKDYADSGYDKGHLACANNHRSGERVQRATFMLSNATPQTPNFNRGIWKRLEAHCEHLTTRAPVWLLTVVLFQSEPNSDMVSYRTIGSNRVPVPTHCGKCVLTTDEDGELVMYAWILANRETPNEDLWKYAVTVDQFESACGYNVWPMLPESEQAELESALPPVVLPNDWPVKLKKRTRDDAGE